MKREPTKYPGINKRYGRYEINYTDSNGKRVFKLLPPAMTLKDAQIERARILEKMYSGQLVVREILGQVCEHVLKTRAPFD